MSDAAIISEPGLVKSASISLAALVTAGAFCYPASASTYFAADETEFRTAITIANADPDASATIVMTADFDIASASIPLPAKPITIDTQGFVLSGIYDAAAASTSSKGTLTLAQNSGGQAVSFSGTIVGAGAGASGTTPGEIGVYLTWTTFTNNGSITGGDGGGGGGAGTAGGIGVRAITHSSVINEGTISGGNSTSSGGGMGVDFGSPAGGPGTLVNNGTIRGGNGPTHGGFSGVGIGVRAGAGSITNTGLIEGGDGGLAITGNSSSFDFDITNSGTIRAGAGQTTAIGYSTAPTTGTITLELRAGSVIEGDVLGNTGAIDTLRLGGTGTDSFDISTIGSQYQNFDTFEKTGTGTWSLTGTGSAQTDWDIQDGTLEIGNGSTSGSVIGDITDNGTLAFNRSDTFDFDNLVSGTGTIRQLGSGKTILTADNSAFAGTTTVEAGTLSVNGILGGTLDVLAGGRLQGNGTVGTATNTGTIAPGNSIGTLTIAGDYIGNGGTLELETRLGDDTSPTDRLVVSGDTSGATTVHVTNVGGSGAATVEGIKIVDIGGVSAGTFSLQGNYVFQGDQAVAIGAYAYRLYKNGISTPTDGDWYLRSALTGAVTTPPVTTTPSDPDTPATDSGTPSTDDPGTPPTDPDTPTTDPVDPTTDPVTPAVPLYQPGIPLYETYGQLLLSANSLPTLQQRLGNRQSSEKGGTAEGAWAFTEGTHGSIRPAESVTVDSYDYDFWKIELGADGEIYSNDRGTLIAGLNARYETFSARIASDQGDGDIRSNGYGAGATLSWYGNDGFYADAQGQLTKYDSDLSSDLAGRMARGNDGFGYALSLELGKRFDLSDAWSVTPQAQLVYSSIDFDSFTDRFGAKVSPGRGDGLIGRLGLALNREQSWTKDDGRTVRSRLYGIANLYSNGANDTTVDVAGVDFEHRSDPIWAGLTIGTSFTWSDERVSLYGEVTAKSSLKDIGDNYGLSGTAGFRLKW